MITTWGERVSIVHPCPTSSHSVSDRDYSRASITDTTELRVLKWGAAHALAIGIIVPTTFCLMTPSKAAFITAVSLIGCFDVLSFLYFFSADRTTHIPTPPVHVFGISPEKKLENQESEMTV